MASRQKARRALDIVKKELAKVATSEVWRNELCPAYLVRRVAVPIAVLTAVALYVGTNLVGKLGALDVFMNFAFVLVGVTSVHVRYWITYGSLRPGASTTTRFLTTWAQIFMIVCTIGFILWSNGTITVGSDIRYVWAYAGLSFILAVYYLVMMGMRRERSRVVVETASAQPYNGPLVRVYSDRRP